MNKKVFLIIFILLAIIITGSILFKKPKTTSVAHAAKVGMPAPDFKLQDINGKIWQLSELQGRIVVLNFWASWCKECKDEKMAIQKYLDKNGSDNDLIFLTVLYKDNPKTVEEMIKKAGYTFPVLVDDGVVSRAYGITGVPETFLIDPRGILRHKIIGPVEWNNPHIVPHLKQVLS